MVQPGRDAGRVLRALDAAVAEPARQRASAVTDWLRRWMTPAARQRCYGVLPAAAFPEGHTGLARTPAGKTWRKLVAFAGRAGVPPQAAFEGLLEFVLLEPSRRSAAERRIQIRTALWASHPLKNQGLRAARSL